MRTCENCGREFKGRAATCTYCGYINASSAVCTMADRRHEIREPEPRRANAVFGIGTYATSDFLVERDGEGDERCEI